jgi:hypothetical protein
MSDSNAWRQVRWMVLPALAGFGAMAGASDRDAFVEGRRVLQEAKRDFDKAPTPDGALALYSISTWLITWAAATGSPARDSDEFREVLSDVNHVLDRVRRKALELE